MGSPRSKQSPGYGVRAASRRERGAATLEIVILFPLVIIFTFGVIEASIWYHARSIALAAAEEGARAAAGADAGGLAAGEAKARAVAADLGDNGMLTDVSVRSGPATADRVSITVTGSSLSILDWIPLEVSQTATAPIERFTNPG